MHLKWADTPSYFSNISYVELLYPGPSLKWTETTDTSFSHFARSFVWPNVKNMDEVTWFQFASCLQVDLRKEKTETCPFSFGTGAGSESMLNDYILYGKKYWKDNSTCLPAMCWVHHGRSQCWHHDGRAFGEMGAFRCAHVSHAVPFQGVQWRHTFSMGFQILDLYIYGMQHFRFALLGSMDPISFSLSVSRVFLPNLGRCSPHSTWPTSSMTITILSSENIQWNLKMC